MQRLVFQKASGVRHIDVSSFCRCFRDCIREIAFRKGTIECNSFSLNVGAADGFGNAGIAGKRCPRKLIHGVLNGDVSLRVHDVIGVGRK